MNDYQWLVIMALVVGFWIGYYIKNGYWLTRLFGVKKDYSNKFDIKDNFRIICRKCNTSKKIKFAIGEIGVVFIHCRNCGNQGNMKTMIIPATKEAKKEESRAVYKHEPSGVKEVIGYPKVPPKRNNVSSKDYLTKLKKEGWTICKLSETELNTYKSIVKNDNTQL